MPLLCPVKILQEIEITIPAPSLSQISCHSLICPVVVHQKVTSLKHLVLTEPYTLEAEAVAAVDLDNFDQEPSRDFVSQTFSDLLSPNYLGDSTDISQESYIMSQQPPPWLQPMIIQIVQAVTATNPQSVSLPPPTADVTERQRQQQLDENRRAIENFKPFKEGHDLEEYLTQLESQFQLLNIPYDKPKIYLSNKLPPSIAKYASDYFPDHAKGYTEVKQRLLHQLGLTVAQASKQYHSLTSSWLANCTPAQVFDVYNRILERIMEDGTAKKQVKAKFVLSSLRQQVTL